MTTTPHPTDALPLPEPFAALSDDETPALYKRWADQIRAAHREGYELAMSNTRERLAAIAEEFEAAIPTGAGLALAAMIREGVTSLGSHIGYAVRSLVKPIHDPAVTTPREVLVGESPVDRIAAPAQEQPISKTDADYWLSIRSGLIDALAARGLQIVSNKDGVRVVEQQQAGAAEVSDEQIEKLAHRMCWQYRHSSDPHHSSTYKFNLTTLLEYTRAAIKAGGVA